MNIWRGARVHRRSAQAKTDLLEIWLRLHDVAGERVADSQIDAITQRFLLLAQYPHIGRDRSADLGDERRCFVVGTYVIIYRVEDSDVLILRVIDGRRDIDALFP